MPERRSCSIRKTGDSPPRFFYACFPPQAPAMIFIDSLLIMTYHREHGFAGGKVNFFRFGAVIYKKRGH